MSDEIIRSLIAVLRSTAVTLGDFGMDTLSGKVLDAIEAEAGWNPRLVPDEPRQGGRMKLPRALLAVAVLSLGFALPAEGQSTTEAKPKCDKKCRARNDVWFKPDAFTDYFVNDSDGGKDSVFTIYHGVPFPAAGEGVKCDVLKSFDAEGVGIAVICPNRVINGSGSTAPALEDE